MKFIFTLITGLFFSACVTLVVTPLPGNKLGRFVKEIISESEQASADWGILAVNLDTGKKIISYNANKLFLPASNTKLYTTAAALRHFGADYRFETPILVNGDIVDSTLVGDLIVLGKGDATWSARFYDGDGKTVFRAWADSLRQHGIKAIKGRMVGVEAIFDDTPMGSGWAWDDEGSYYSAPISGLTFNENSQDVTIIPQSGGAMPIIEPNPVTAYTTINNQLVTLDTLNNPDSLEADWDFSRPRDANVITFEGLFSPDTVETGASVFDPVLFTITVLRETLIESGMQVSDSLITIDIFEGDSIATKVPGDTLFIHSSPPLGKIVYELNKASQNLMAETLLRAMGADSTAGGSARAGQRRARVYWAAMGVDTTMVYLVDGSGLSRYNKVTPENTVQLLTAMFPDTSFFNSLPISGVDGTLEKLMTNGPAAGRVHAKTGTLRHVRALGGYIENRKGEWIVFSILVNDHLSPLRDVNQKIKRICELLVTRT